MAKPNQQADEELAPGTVIDGRYRVVRSIGQGGNGLVYEVEHTRTGRRLALKALLDETGFARLEQEARAASLMKNGHTAKIIDMEPGGATGPYMVMELLEGQSLRALLDEAGQLPLELTVNIAMQVCECLLEAHELGIIHRDLKPENIFLCPSPWPGQVDVKVLDFGVMKVAEGGGAIPKSSLTRTGSTVGTPYYMSLEQLRNSSAVDARADVYSLGVVLYECLSGRKPFQAETIGDLVYALCSGPPTPLGRLRPDLPAEVPAVVMRTLSANRDERPATMLDLAAAFLGIAAPQFALWVKIDGKQVAIAPLAPRAPASFPASAAGPAPPPPRPSQAARNVPTGPVPTSVLSTAEAAAAIAALENRAPETKQGWPPPPVAADDGPRDTPTEMYVKGVHGPDAAPGAEPAGEPGDRDTPTRAYNVESGTAARAPLLQTLKSPVLAGGGEAGATSDDEDADAMTTFKRAPPPAPSTPGGVPAAPPSAPAFGAPPPGSMMTVPLGNILRNLPVSMQPQVQAAMQPAPAPSSRAKPAWQSALDRALIAVGRTSETLVRRFREAPQNTQIVVIIVAGTAVLLFLGIVIFLARG